MADGPQHEISSGQLAVFLISSQLGLGIIALPRLVAEEAGHAGWWLVLAMGLLIVAGVGFTLALCGRMQSSILAAHRRILGAIPGGILNALILLLLLLTTIANVVYFIQIMKIVFFKATPLPALIAILMTPMIYLTAKGLKVIARFDTFVYIALLALFGMVLAARNRADWTFLLPLTAFKTHAFLKVLPKLAFGFIGFDLLLIVYPRVRRGPGIALAAAGFTALVTTAFVAFATAYYGEMFLPKLVFPLLSLVRTIEAPVIERLEIYFTMIWLPAMMSCANTFFIATELAVVELFPRLPYRLVLALLSAIVIVAALYLRDFSMVERFAAAISPIEFFGFGLLWPALLWCLAALRGIRA